MLPLHPYYASEDTPERIRAEVPSVRSMTSRVYIGCAGWSLSKEHFPLFPDEGTHLERYATRFNCVEINSSFYRSHRASTYERWANATPEGFRFAVKLPKQITHLARLKDSDEAILRFSAEVCGLGPKLGVVLVQLPPSLSFEQRVASRFLRRLMAETPGPLAVEPRHASWFDSAATLFFEENRIARVAADPAVVPAAKQPIAARGLVYYRWHGSPRTYYSAYGEQELHQLADSMSVATTEALDAWCIFDNTAAGAATVNALSLSKQMNKGD